jgi:hypothetical protein
MKALRYWSIGLCLTAVTAAVVSTHRPIPALDLFAVEGHDPYRTVAAADYSSRRKPSEMR